MSIVAIQSPGEVQEQIDATKAERDGNQAATGQSDVVNALASHVRKCWEIAKYDRQVVNGRLLNCLRRRTGEYDADKLAAIRQMGGSDIYMMITAAKCRNAKAWLADLFAPAGDRPFSLEPTPIADLPPDIMQKMVSAAVQAANEMNIPMELVQQELLKHRDRLMGELQKDAEERGERMADAIEDLLVEGEWREAFNEFLDDLVTYPAAILKGLEFRRTKTLKWVDHNGTFHPEAGHKIIGKVRRVSPFRAYPSPSTGNSMSGHWFIEHHTLTRQDLSDMRTAPGYNAEGIAQAVLQHGQGGLKEWIWSEQERARLENRTNIYNTEDIDALEYTGSLRGQTLLDFGMNPKEIPDPLEEYSVSVMVVGHHVIRALVNPDPAGKNDYFKANWQTVPGSFWGEAPPELLAHTQDTCNAASRALVNNMGHASGPMGVIEMDRLAAGEDPDAVYPWRMWKSNSANQGSSPGVSFFQASSNAAELMAVYEKFSTYGDEIMGMPAYTAGSDAGAGAAKTASGLSMLMNAASKTVKDVVRNIDIYVIEPLVEKCYNHLMLTHPDPMIKGDLIPKARGSEALVHKEQAQLRQQELLGITANDIDLSIIGKNGRRAMLEEVLKTGNLPVDRILPSEEEMNENDAQQQQAAEQQPQQQPTQQPAASQQPAQR
jgi:hypothetical protein